MPPEAARREVLEETGIALGEAEPMPIDIDSHEIPANQKKNESGHTHHDFRFAFAVDRTKFALALQENEVADADWIGLDDPRFPADLRQCVKRAMESGAGRTT